MLLMVTIGFALLSTTLKINGITGINKNTWDIHWDDTSISETTGSVTATTPAAVTDAEEKNISFEVEFELPGDFYEFTVDAVNEGSIDGKIETISIKFYEADGTTEIAAADLPDEITYSLTHKDGSAIGENEVITHGGGKIGYKFRIGFDSQVDTLPSDTIVIKPDIEITPVQYKEECPSPVSFSEDEWSTIQCNVKKGNTDAYNLGDIKTVTLGSMGERSLRLVNKSTPSECNSPSFSQTGCGFVVEFYDPIANSMMNTWDSGRIYEDGNGNKGGWEHSALRKYVLPNFINDYFPEDMKEVMIDTKVVSSHGTNDTDNFVTTDKVYLLSSREVWGNSGTSDTTVNETRKLDYYDEGTDYGSDACAKRIKKFYGSAVFWWTRSADSWDYHYFFRVNADGSNGGAESENSSTYIAPAFRIG